MSNINSLISLIKARPEIVTYLAEGPVVLPALGSNILQKANAVTSTSVTAFSCLHFDAGFMTSMQSQAAFAQ